MSSSDLTVISEPSNSLSLGSTSQFDHIQRVAKMFAESQLVPVTFQKNLPNCVIALEMAQRIHASPMMLMQNLNIIHGKPSFGSSFMIASVNSSGRFSPLRFIYVGTEGEDDWGCYAVAKAKEDGAECKGVTVTMAIAKAEGWLSKSGSKWKTMPQLMFSYRAATWWTRMFAPELLMGFQTAEEVYDVVTTTVADPVAPAADPGVEKIARSRKGVSGMKDVTPVKVETAAAEQTQPAATAGANPEPTTPIPAETPTVEPPPPVEITPPPAPAATPPPPAPVAPPVRCTVKAVTERDAKVDGKPAKICEVELVGEYAGIAYFNGTAAVFPNAGTVIDAVLTAKPYKGATTYIIDKFTVLAG